MSSVATPRMERKRVNFILSEKAYSELALMSKETGHSMTELVRLALGLIKVVLAAGQNGHKLIVTTADGNPLKEIVLPG